MNGNILVSHIESRVVNHRLKTIDDPFAWSLTPYVVTPQQHRYFNTTTPYSNVAYKKGFTSGHEENDIDFLFTANLNRRLNFKSHNKKRTEVVRFADTAVHYGAVTRVPTIRCTPFSDGRVSVRSITED